MRISFSQEQLVEEVTTTIEEIQIQPKQEQQVVQTTTEVEEQPTPQVKTDVSSTQPKPQEQVSDQDLAVFLCEFAVN